MSLRLDQILTARGLAPTRSRARDLILRGLVLVDGAVQTKPGALVTDRAVLSVSGESDYVSRGTLKLAAALEAFGFDPAGRVALDVGASTGGFTEVLLARGAVKVYAVDVGHGQLHQKLKDDARVISLEGRDARSLAREDIPEPVGAIVADVSFISLEKALPAALALASRGAWLVALVKPQFEAGREAVGKGGIVRDAAVREAQGMRIQAWLDQQPGWHSVGLMPSPIQGGSGNEEYLVGARFDG
jgi:23S rRNA (cytidine1920-2'-O)/16S rRNA (cytidine1409-2'-O)-methyltransferase